MERSAGGLTGPSAQTFLIFHVIPAQAGISISKHTHHLPNPVILTKVRIHDHYPVAASHTKHRRPAPWGLQMTRSFVTSKNETGAHGGFYPVAVGHTSPSSSSRHQRCCRFVIHQRPVPLMNGGIQFPTVQENIHIVSSYCAPPRHPRESRDLYFKAHPPSPTQPRHPDEGQDPRSLFRGRRPHPMCVIPAKAGISFERGCYPQSMQKQHKINF